MSYVQRKNGQNRVTGRNLKSENLVCVLLLIWKLYSLVLENGEQFLQFFIFLIYFSETEIGKLKGKRRSFFSMIKQDH